MKPDSNLSGARVLITGADGFVGRHLQTLLAHRGIEQRLAVRANSGAASLPCVAVGDVGPHTDWRAALEEVDVVVHLAARAHVLRETAGDPRTAFMQVNAEGTATLVRAAASSGVRRFIYMSSVGVLGNSTPGAPFSPDSPPQPHNLYAQSKLAGELAANEGAGKMEVVVLRPPLVYGPGVRANFLRLLRWVDAGWPLPLGAVSNLRSLVSVGNLCDLILRVSESAVAPGRAWLVSDGEDVSTPDLIRRIAKAMAKPARLVPVPSGVLAGLARLAGVSGQFTQLCGSLVLDIAATRTELAWSPPESLDTGLARTVSWYRSERRPGI